MIDLRPQWSMRVLDSVLDAVFPPSCAFCGKLLPPGRYAGACDDCRKSLWILHPPVCRVCGKPFEAGELSRLCGDCAHDPPDFDLLRTPFAYSGPLRDALIMFKFKRRPHYARPLADLLTTVSGLGINWKDYDFAVPVPLHTTRIRERGFNQSLLLTRRALSGTELPIRHAILARIKPTAPQVGLSGAQRRDNVRGAFAVTDKPAVEGKKILLIDDIATTGATLSACARVLKRAGAARVDAIAVARAVNLIPETETGQPRVQPKKDWS